MKNYLYILFLGLSLQFGPSTTDSASFTGDGPLYDYSAYTECKSAPEDPLYGGGIIKNQSLGVYNRPHPPRFPVNSPAFVLNNLTGNTIYCFSSWVKITAGAASAVIKASLTTDNVTFNCMGTVIAKRGCWSFLKGGFVLDSPSTYALIYFQNSDGQPISISVSSASLQPFTDQQWKINQQNMLNTERKRTATLHVSDIDGNRLQGATVVVEQVSRDFPFGSAIANTILGNLPYQNLLGVTRLVRGHNIFWEDPDFTPSWVRNLTSSELKSAVSSRIQSLMNQYRNEFIHWDVDNEMLHWDFYEQRLGPNASLEFFQTAQKSDPLARLFMNEYNVLETCDDMNSTVDHYVARLQELGEGGVSMDGIGLEGHFTVPNPPLIRAILDKLATLKLPIWLTEVDISNSLDQETQVRRQRIANTTLYTNLNHQESFSSRTFLNYTAHSILILQAKYLEVVVREGFSHPSVKGIMLWTALHPSGCYRMCLTDNNFHNLPAGDVVDSLLKEWETGVVKGETDDHGAFDFSGFLGEYRVTVDYGNRTTNSTFSLCQDDETKHWNIHL
ncbi:UNVERIFIED_CONTAM: Endo-1,4-beta-xylanase 5 [Sesamum latifolium]|uniref:Endo-1,4-beta-xylanase 5 n=1 Tax=Sesamum latifolium TaxID=2727402 RepID=A0AAW2V2T9_9LAMI